MKYALIKNSAGTIEGIFLFCSNQVLPNEYQEVSYSEWETARQSITDIIQIKIQCCDRIDKTAGDIRLKYITEVPGQQATYWMKTEEARSIKAAGLIDGIDMTPYPLIQAEMNATGYGMTLVVNSILDTEASWRQLAAKIEEVRRKGKINIKAATSVLDVLIQESYALSAMSSL